jgi:hypothetical protein
MDLSNVLNGVAAQEDQQEKSALPTGHYNVTIEKVEGKTNETTGSKGVNMQLRVFGAKFNNYVIFDYMLIAGNEAALKYSLPKLKKLGALCGSENTATWVGKKVNVNLSLDKRDETKNIIWSYQSVADVGEEPVINSSQSNITASDLPF